MTVRIRLAEIVIEIRCMYGDVPRMCRDYALPEGCADGTDIRIGTAPADVEKERERALRMYRGGAFTDGYLESAAVLRAVAEAMPAYDTFLMHGSVIASGGQGYMICAPSGVGKSTRTKLWLDCVPGSFVVNGDKPLLRVGVDAVTAYGTPWCGKEGWNRNTGVPLAAIYLLERGENDVREIGMAEALPTLLRQTYRAASAETRRKTLRLIEGLAGKVRLFRFASTPDEAAVRMALRAAGGDA